jgi:hypothetical protein
MSISIKKLLWLLVSVCGLGSTASQTAVLFSTLIQNLSLSPACGLKPGLASGFPRLVGRLRAS